MIEPIILYPIFGHIFLVLSLYILLALRKAAAIKSKQVNRNQVALNNKAWPDTVVQVSNNLANQFESPILFYVLCLIIYTTNISSHLLVSLAWIYVLLRYVHTYIHTGSNFVPYRMRTFILSIFTLLAMLVISFYKLLG